MAGELRASFLGRDPTSAEKVQRRHPMNRVGPLAYGRQPKEAITDWQEPGRARG